MDDGDNVVYLDVETPLDIPISRMRNIPFEDFEDAVVLCVKDGEITVFSNKADIRTAVYYAQQFAWDVYSGKVNE